MRTAQKLKLCNRWLGCTLLLMLASGIQLEAGSGQYMWSVWLHVILGIVLIALSIFHIFLHYGFGNWFSRFKKNRNIATRIIWWFFLLTTVSGVAATVIWIDGYGHSHIGGIHGKIGFLMVITAIFHVRKHLALKNDGVCGDSRN